MPASLPFVITFLISCMTDQSFAGRWGSSLLCWVQLCYARSLLIVRRAELVPDPSQTCTFHSPMTSGRCRRAGARNSILYACSSQGMHTKHTHTMWAYAQRHHYRTTSMPLSILLTQGPVLLGGSEAAASTGAPAPDSSHSHLKVIIHACVNCCEALCNKSSRSTSACL